MQNIEQLTNQLKDTLQGQINNSHVQAQEIVNKHLLALSDHIQASYAECAAAIKQELEQLFDQQL